MTRNLGALEEKLAVACIDTHRVTLREPTLEQLPRQRILEQLLDRTLERPGPVRRIPSRFRDELPPGIGDLELDAALRKPRAKTVELQLDDLSELLAGEPLEDDHLIDPIQELRTKAFSQLVRRANVRGHDDDGVAKVDRSPSAVGEPPVVQ